MKKIIVDIACLLLVVLFAYAAVNKLLSYNYFIEQMSGSVMSKPFRYVLAWLVPSVELIICIMLIVPNWRIKGLMASFYLMVAFTIYVMSLLTINGHIPCTCGGIISRFNWTEHLIFNIFFTLIAFIGWRLEKRNFLFIKSNNRHIITTN